LRCFRDEEKYKKYRKHYKKVITEAKKRYYKDLFDARTNSVKKLWNNLNQMASLGKRNSTNNVHKLLVNNTFIMDQKLISNHFNEYFCNIGTNLQNKFRLCNDSDFKLYLSHPVSESMYCEPISINEFLDIIAKLNNNKSPGPDMITPLPYSLSLPLLQHFTSVQQCFSSMLLHCHFKQLY